MDTSNRRPTQGAVGDPTMESGDWRAQLQRQRIVNKIMDTLKRHLPFSGYERLSELKKIAERVEEEIYTAATSQSEYTRKICFMMLTMDTRLPYPMHPNSAALYNSVNPSVPLDSSANWQEEVYQKIETMKDLYLNGDAWQEEVYQKIKAMKDLYLPYLNAMHQKILSKLQQHNSLPQQPNNEQLEKLKVFKNMLERFMQFLQIPKHAILANYKDKLSTYEKQIINVINSYRRKPAPPQQQTQRDMKQRLETAGSFKKQNVIDMQTRLCPQKRATPEASSTSLDSTAQTSNPNGGDWQDEVYQKIKAMKDLYLLDLNDIHQKVVSKLQEHDSLPQQPKNEQLEKLKAFKNMLERFMQFLQIPKHGILANGKDKLPTYERLIIDVINTDRRKPAAPQEQPQAWPRSQ